MCWNGALLLLYRRRLYSVKFAFLNDIGMKHTRKNRKEMKSACKRPCFGCNSPSLCVYNNYQRHLQLHGFVNARKMAVCAAIYTVSYCGESRRIDRNLLVNKSRVAPKNLSIPRLKLVGAHTLAKLHKKRSKML